jgi:DNA polymerase sigma
VIDVAQPYMLCLQDPADPLNDLGHKAFGFKHIKKTIMELRRTLLTLEKAPAKMDISWLDEFVGPCYEAYKARREIAEAFGRAALTSEPAIDSSASTTASLSGDSDTSASADPNCENVLRSRLGSEEDLEHIIGERLAQQDELEQEDESEQREEAEQKNGNPYSTEGP